MGGEGRGILREGKTRRARAAEYRATKANYARARKQRANTAARRSRSNSLDGDTNVWIDLAPAPYATDAPPVLLVADKATR